MSNDLWRWADPAGQQRRVRLDELRAALASGLVAPNTPVWRPGFPAWIPAHDVPELTTSALSAANGVVPNIPPPPLAMVAVQHEFEALAGVPEVSSSSEEPPPPPHYVPAPVKPSLIPPAPGSSASSFPSSGGTPAVPKAAPSAPSMGTSLPTTIGLPPPPDLLAAVAEAKAKAAPTGKPVPSKPPPPVRRRSNPMVEELTGSAILPDSDPILTGGLPAPTDPIVHGEGAAQGEPRGSDPGDAAFGLPRQGGLSIILDDVRALRAGQKPKNKLVVPVLGLLAFSLLIMLVAGVVSLFGGSKSNEVATSSSASSLTSAAPSSVATASASPRRDVIPPPPEASAAAAVPVAAPVNAPSGEAFGPCTLGGDDKVVAPRAVVATGIEAAALNGSIMLGFAPAPGNGTVVALDPSSLAVGSTVKGKGPAAEVKRVTPALSSSGRLVAFVDGERKNDKLASRRAVGTATPIDIGVAEGAIVWTLHGKDGWAKVTSLDDGAGPVEALRAVPLAGQKGIAFVYRRDGAVFFGAATGEGKLELAGSVAKVPGLGQVGSPAIAVSDDTVVVAWADRAGADSPWQVRWTKATIGGAAAEASTFALPAGGLGEQAMSPALAGLGKGRFAIAWTEGPVAKHQVRTVAIDEAGKPMGEALTVSDASVNAGQPQVSVGPDGRGVVAFLGAKGRAYELRAASLRCGK